jgi:hypothetical protein
MNTTNNVMNNNNNTYKKINKNDALITKWTIMVIPKNVNKDDEHYQHNE